MKNKTEPTDKKNRPQIDAGVLINLIMDDAYACSFQTLGQYRSALVKEVDRLSKLYQGK